MITPKAQLMMFERNDWDAIRNFLEVIKFVELKILHHQVNLIKQFSYSQGCPKDKQAQE